VTLHATIIVTCLAAVLMPMTTTPASEFPSPMASEALSAPPAPLNDSAAGHSSPIISDTTTARLHLRRDTMLAWSSFFESPTGTLLKSVVFPGWGQWSNGKKQMAAVYFAIETYFATKALIWRHRARQNVDYYTFMHARDRRNYFYWFTGLTIFISMFDAYADRYLLTLEHMRQQPEEYWGGQSAWRSRPAADGWRLSLAYRF